MRNKGISRLGKIKILNIQLTDVTHVKHLTELEELYANCLLLLENVHSANICALDTYDDHGDFSSFYKLKNLRLHSKGLGKHMKNFENIQCLFNLVILDISDYIGVDIAGAINLRFHPNLRHLFVRNRIGSSEIWSKDFIVTQPWHSYLKPKLGTMLQKITNLPINEIEYFFIGNENFFLL